MPSSLRPERRRLRVASAFRQDLTSCLLNPKVDIFFVAVVTAGHATVRCPGYGCSAPPARAS